MNKPAMSQTPNSENLSFSLLVCKSSDLVHAGSAPPSCFGTGHVTVLSALPQSTPAQSWGN